MKKPKGGGLRGAAKIADKMQKAAEKQAAQADADETAALEAHQVRAAEIDARPTFGSIVVEQLRWQAQLERESIQSGSRRTATYLEDMVNDEDFAQFRRTDGIRHELLRKAHTAPVFIRTSVISRVKKAINDAVEKAGPSGYELHAENDARLEALDLDGAN